MHRTIYLTTVLLFTGTLFSACEKSDIDPAKLGDPVKIELRGAEAEIVKTDQQFAFDFFNHHLGKEVQRLILTAGPISRCFVVSCHRLQALVLWIVRLWHILSQLVHLA